MNNEVKDQILAEIAEEIENTDVMLKMVKEDFEITKSLFDQGRSIAYEAGSNTLCRLYQRILNILSN